MRSIILGTKDYCKDCWHDWLRCRVMAYGGKVMDCVRDIKDNNKWWTESDPWKEGSLWHYIQQRRIAKQMGRR